MALEPGSKLGPYEIVALLGRGGMGEVYRARDPKLRRDVAIKVLPDHFARDAIASHASHREAQLLAALNHPHIAHISRSRRLQRHPALVMELVEGPTLADRLAQGPLPVREALDTACQIAEAIEAAHEKNVIHRDLKPANVKFAADGSVKVLDFGLAKAVEAKRQTRSVRASDDGATEAGQVLGTRGLYEPEQARGQAVDRRRMCGPSAACSSRCSPAAARSAATRSPTRSPVSSRAIRTGRPAGADARKRHEAAPPLSRKGPQAAPARRRRRATRAGGRDCARFAHRRRAFDTASRIAPRGHERAGGRGRRRRDHRRLHDRRGVDGLPRDVMRFAIPLETGDTISPAS